MALGGWELRMGTIVHVCARTRSGGCGALLGALLGDCGGTRAQGRYMLERHRVAVYVLDRVTGSGDTSRGSRVLCFDHADFPEAGTQIPAGGVAEGETVEAAAAREVLEETGIRMSRPRALGVQVLEDRSIGVRKLTTFLAAVAIDPPTGLWRHTVPPQTGDDSGMVFECFFLTFGEASAALTVDRQGQFLSLVPGDCGSLAE
jgi:8-oxo-dGTP pyrophosphatase MutT (NUDIX family)